MIKVNNIKVPHFTFPGGEVQVGIGEVPVSGKLTIEAYLYNSDEVMKLLLTIDAVRRLKPGVWISLHLPYLPYARQDRVCNEGEALAVKVMTNLINSLELDEVVLYDPHSDAAGALLNNVRVIPQHQLMMEMSGFIIENELLIVSPDAGAEKKAMKLAQHLSEDREIELIHASKQRDTKTGAIVVTMIKGDVKNKSILVVDDICDGGRTFIELAKVLKEKGAKEIFLYVTHGIFSKGLEPLRPHFTKIFCYHVFPQVSKDEPEFLTILTQ